MKNKNLQRPRLLDFILKAIKNNKKLQRHLRINFMLIAIVTICLLLYLIKNNNIELSHLLSIRFLVGIAFFSFINKHIYFQINEYNELSDMKWWLATSVIYLILSVILWVTLWFIFRLFNINTYSIILFIPLIMALVSDIIALIIFSIKAFFSKDEYENEYEDTNKFNY